ncbi:MAG: hypothetical protein A2665_02765 [Candidatus Zambryskibacteria bacterium RIFCSPHIGHO2_01_FULL_46_30]|uniref:DUF2059 domain-containing protein n=1 Tax=Candidatus Zambryskibacteria bacterium RIFCSPHIGHO2_01_FULL_46_30 TaxID=1802739 RepID=A0A1G2SZV2_9BACT|nr:MAG: hypothetical protein A2665_02765 [Candidatus Zambryskibacteria bacterium RIFCSPHIGHO2_01_FULL_46_30]OHB05156.1 MAG: hypothetical protein A3B22_02595 [Candidatus Zambryskibacteria bacterium RIFCSPLOWO2_01_FULL_47_33]
MKSLMFVLSGMVVVFLAMASSAYSQGVPDTLENRRIAAEQYLAAVPPAEIIADGIRELAALRPEGQRDEAVRLMRALVRPDRMRLIMMEAMLKRFTAQELDALAGFYGSEVGRSIVKKFGVYMADIQPHIQAEFARVLRELELQSR